MMKMSHRNLNVGAEDAGERVLRRVEEQHSGRTPKPSAEQVAMVLKALSDPEHNLFMVSDKVQDLSATVYSSGNWSKAEGLKAYFLALAENIEFTAHKNRTAA